MLKKIAFFIFSYFFACIGNTFCQENNLGGETIDFMRSNEKIYVVMAVVVTIVLGLYIYLYLLDRKITRVEKGKE